MDLSIIIPMYNHEEYVEQAIRSMVKDLSYDAEIIVINDASTDSSLNIVKKLQTEITNIKILNNEKNHGCAYSINRGLEAAQGKYIGINSSDDFVDEGYYQKMLDVAFKKNADVVCANIANYNTKTNEITYCKIEEGNIAFQDFQYNNEPIQIESTVLLGHWTASSSSTKIIKKEYYNKYKFIGTKANDIPCIYPILAAAEKVIYYPNLYKYYRIVEKSLSRRADEQSYNSVIESIIITFKLLDDINAEQEKEVLFFNNCMEYFIYVLGEIANEELKIRCIINFYNTLRKYENNIFEKMKKSAYFENFIKKNYISEEEYNKLVEERPCEFIYSRKLLEKNKRLQTEVLNLGEFNRNLKIENENLQKTNEVIRQEKEKICEENKIIKEEKEKNYLENKKIVEENKELFYANERIKEEKELINIELNETKEVNTQLKERINILNNVIKSYEESRSWKVTKPIRKISSRIRKMMK